jgi:BirA family biotin operon repressor/biotin-[acetyl-CoA-carboxylase] ligase
MSREPPVFGADLTAPHDPLPRFELEDLVHEQKRRAVRDERLDDVASERRFHPTSLVGVRFGTPCTHVDETESTQRLLGEDDPEGALVVADHQTAGRGRLGRTWQDVPGKSLLFSLLLRPSAPMPLWPELSLVAGEAVARAVGGEVRPPNDVFLNGKKVAGVLPEATRGRVVLGIGVNVNHTEDELPKDTVKPPTSLRVETGREHDRDALLLEILAELERAYDDWDGRYRR